MMKWLKTSYLSLVYLFLYLPLATLVILSFNSNKYMTSWKGGTLKWYTKLLGNDELINAAIHSLTVAFSSATCAAILGTLAAIALYRYRFKGRRIMQSSLFVLMVSPDIVMGISLMVLFLSVGLAQGFVTLLLAHITFCLPFVTVTVYSRMQGFDRQIIEAAGDLGAGEYQTFRYVILPLVRPAVLTGWLLGFTLSLDDVIVSFFVTGPTYEVLPLRIYSMVRVGISPEVNALSAIMIAATVLVVFTTHFIMRKR
jgi:spermidine/putrescine transport system permease protein